MSNVVVCMRNRLVEEVTPPIVKSTPSADPSFPLANVLHRSREKFWKCGPTAPGTATVDLDLRVGVPYRVVGITRNRKHGSGTGITNVAIYTSTSATYPPGAWTSRGSFAVTPTVDTVALDMGSVTVRQLRYTITDSGPYSCRLWAARTADYVALSSEGAAVAEQRWRERKGSSNLLGHEGYNDYGQRRIVRLTHAMASAAQRTTWRNSVGEAMLVLLPDGGWCECRHGSTPEVERAISSSALYNHRLVLEVQP